MSIFCDAIVRLTEASSTKGAIAITEEQQPENIIYPANIESHNLRRRSMRVAMIMAQKLCPLDAKVRSIAWEVVPINTHEPREKKRKRKAKS